MMDEIRCDTCEFRGTHHGYFCCTKTPDVRIIDVMGLSWRIRPDWCPLRNEAIPDPPDDISHPPHYNRFPIEPVQFLNALTRPLSGPPVPWNGLNVIKYLTRYQVKGTPMKDLLKARQYLDWLIEDEEKAAREL